MRGFAVKLAFTCGSEIKTIAGSTDGRPGGVTRLLLQVERDKCQMDLYIYILHI